MITDFLSWAFLVTFSRKFRGPSHATWKTLAVFIVLALICVAGMIWEAVRSEPSDAAKALVDAAIFAGFAGCIVVAWNEIRDLLPKFMAGRHTRSTWERS